MRADCCCFIVNTKAVHQISAISTTLMNEVPSKAPQITLEGPNDNKRNDNDRDNNERDDTPSNSQDLSIGFLHAQTRSLHQRLRSRESDRSMDWENYVVSSATDYPAPMELFSDSVMKTDDQVTYIHAHLIKIFRNFEKYKKFLSYRDEPAKDLLDLLQMLLDHAAPEPRLRVIFYVALVRLCRKSELCPRWFSLTDVHVDLTEAFSGGGFSDIYQGQYNGKASQAFSREAVVWGQLSHPNILPFYGIFRLTDPSDKLCLVSPWMYNGTIKSFLSNPARSQRDRTPLISDVASGMKYLHENGVVHGDLKSVNILITEFERACLADFGFSYVKEAGGLGGYDLSSRQADGGTPGFQAPEFAESDELNRTSASDVFAFSMVCLEIFTGELPFNGSQKLQAHILKEKRPTRPTEKVHVQRGLTDMMWALIERCWSHSPGNRPTAAEILQELPPVEINSQCQSWDSQRMTGGQMDATIKKALAHLQPLL
ncbi:Serine/threonine-protein kinase HT1 [Termitomyces sp. J132]|nr:Serine/threonine-protein kinase HT1 [Termitomyces sp. J132]